MFCFVYMHRNMPTKLKPVGFEPHMPDHQGDQGDYTNTLNTTLKF